MYIMGVCRKGRRWVVMMGCVCSGVVCCVNAAVNNIWLMGACRLVMGMLFPCIHQTVYVLGKSPRHACIQYVLVVELVSTRQRMRAGTLIELAFAVGVIAMAGLAYVTPHWRVLLFVTGAPLLPAAALLRYSLCLPSHETIHADWCPNHHAGCCR